MEDLITELKRDHDEVRRLVWVLEMLVLRGEDKLARERAEDLQVFLGSHFLKEEARLREILEYSNFVDPSSPPSSFSESEARQKMRMDSLISKHGAMRDSFELIQRMTTLSDYREKLTAFDDFERTILNFLKEEENTDLLLSFAPKVKEEEKTAKVIINAQGSP